MDSIDIDIKKYEGDVWFPMTVIFQRKKDEKLVYRNVVTVSDATFNQPVDPKVFTLTGMGIPAGTPIVYKNGPPHPATMWNGKEVVLR